MLLIKKTIKIKTTELSDQFEDDELDNLLDDLDDWLNERLNILSLQATSDNWFGENIKVEIE